MSSFLRLLVLIFGMAILCVTACSYENDYAKRMEKLASQAHSSSAEGSAAIDQLIQFSGSADYWERYYALVYLGQTALAGNTEVHVRVIPVLAGALDDKHQAVQRDVVCAIRDIGAEAVDQVVPQLIHFVNSRDERDVSWFAAEALGKSKDARNRQQIINTLVQALDKRPNQLPLEAPQIR